MTREEIEEAAKREPWYNSLTQAEREAAIQRMAEEGQETTQHRKKYKAKDLFGWG